jgi:hypothetical protein
MRLGRFALDLRLQSVLLVVIKLRVKHIILHVLLGHVDIVVIVYLLLDIPSILVYFDVFGILPVCFFTWVLKLILFVVAEHLVQSLHSKRLLHV